MAGTVGRVRAARLLALLLVIQRTGRATAAQLAEELEVSEPPTSTPASVPSPPGCA